EHTNRKASRERQRPARRKVQESTTFPIRLPFCSVNQRVPSRPTVIPNGWLPAVGTANSVTTPVVVTRPILLPPFSVNQRAPSLPLTICCGPLPAARAI